MKHDERIVIQREKREGRIDNPPQINNLSQGFPLFLTEIGVMVIIVTQEAD